MKPKVFLLALAFFVPFIPAIVSSHGVSITAHWEGEEVHTDRYFADGKPVGNARVVAYDMNGDVTLEGLTDETGTWNFPNPKVGDLRIVIKTASGHKSEAVLKKGSIRGRTEYQEQTIDSRLTSIQESILELEKRISKPGISEILGGLGWIIGLAGAFLWGMSRRRRPGNQ